MISLLAAIAIAPKPPHELLDYLAKKDKSIKWQVTKQTAGRTDIDLTSQTWQGAPWRHDIVMVQPTKVQHPGTAILYITGGKPNPQDVAEASLAAEITAMPVALLFGIPNQPLWGMTEDDLIAHTFEKYLETKDPTWPLLFPMAKSGIRAMDALQAATKGTKNPIRRFVVTGGSKRGWTTWMVAASGDKRISGIAPMVIDNLNVPAQMRHQIETWGQYSEQIQDYTRRGLQQKLETPDGMHLARIVDPYSYRDAIKTPTLIVNGSNDPYWTVDALNQYWGDLKQPKWVTIVPNAGHLLGNKIQAIEAIGAFARSVSGGPKLPKVTWEYAPLRNPGGYSLTAHVRGPGLSAFSLWMAESDTLDFRQSVWKKVETKPFEASATAKGANPAISFNVPPNKNVAVFGELRIKSGARGCTLSTQVKVFKKR
jgi:PhoPQ-activated pathogenicity-related protein